LRGLLDAHHISRASLRHWAKTDPALNRAFDTFEANKAHAQAKREWVKSYQQVADAIVDAAKDGEPDPVKTALEAVESDKEPRPPPLSPEEARQRRLLEWFNSDLDPASSRQWSAGGNRTPTRPPRLLVGVKKLEAKAALPSGVREEGVTGTSLTRERRFDFRILDNSCVT
jgi:hypothetical protein